MFWTNLENFLEKSFENFEKSKKMSKKWSSNTIRIKRYEDEENENENDDDEENDQKCLSNFEIFGEYDLRDVLYTN